MKIVRFLLWAALTASLAAFADDPQPASTDKVLTEQDVVVTASRTERQADTVAANVTVFTAEDIAHSNAKSIPELLRDVPGVYVNDLFGNGTNVFFDIGGFGETGPQNTMVLVDGLRYDYGDLAGTDWTSIPLNQIDRIEVQVGGNAALYGGGATGGVVNIITRAGERNRASLALGVDSWGYSESAEVSQRLTEELGYTVKQGFQESDGYRANNNYRSKNLHLGVSLKPASSPFSLELRAGDNVEDMGLPGGLTRTQLNTGFDRRDSDEPNSHGWRRTTYVTAIPAIELGEGTHKFQLPVTYREREGRFRYSGYPLDSRDVVFGLAPQYTLATELAGMPNTLVLGVEYYSNEKHNLQNQAESQRRTFDAFVANTLEPIENVFIDLAYRRGEANYGFDDFNQDFGFDDEAYHAGIAWNYQPGSKLYALYDRSYRFGSLDEYSFFSSIDFLIHLNRGLNPQKTETWKAGVVHRFDERLTAGLAVFQIDTEHEIFYDPNDTDITSFGANDDYDQTRRQGFLVELKSQFCERASGYLNYTYMNARLLSDDGSTNYDGSRIPMVPESVVSGGTEIALLDNLALNVDARWIDERMLASDWNNDREPLDSYYTVDARLTYSWKWLTLFGGVSNLTDEEYEAFGGYNAFAGDTVWPGVGRNYFAGLKATWDF